MRGKPVRFIDFRGGLNTKANSYLIDNNQCRDCLNVVSTTRGSIKKRGGNTLLASSFAGSPANITSLFGTNVGANTLIATGGTKIYTISSVGTAQDISAAPLTTDLRWSMISAPTSGGQGPNYLMNGTDTPIFYSGVGTVASWTASVGSVPNGKYMEYAANRVWVAGTTANPSRVYFSDLGDPRSWTATNVVDLDPNDGQTITGIKRLGANLLVFKQSKTFLIYDLDSGANRAISTSIGCVAPRSIAESQNGLYFLSEDQGVFVTNGSELKRISDNIQPIFDVMADGVKPLATGTFFNDHYYISCGDISSVKNVFTLDYDVTTNSWWKHSNSVNQFALWRPTLTADMNIYVADASTPRVQTAYVTGVRQDSGTNFQTSWTGPWLTYDEPYRNKRMRQIHLDGTGTVNVYVAKDYAYGDTLVGTDIFDGAVSTSGSGGTFGGGGIFGDAGQSRARLYSQGVARAFSLRFDATSNNDFEIDSYTTLITPRQN